MNVSKSNLLSSIGKDKDEREIIGNSSTASS